MVVLALPEILGGVGIGLDQLDRAAPVVTVFLLGYVALLPLVGRLSDRVGRAPVLLGCLLLFAVGSAVTAGADTLGVLVAGRGLQGAGGGGLVPVTLALVADLWDEDRRGVPLGLVGAAQELGAVLGPLAGAGVLVLAGWRAIFWANLVVALALAVGLALLPRDRPGGGATTRLRPVDPVGTLLATAAVVAGLVATARPAPLADSVRWGGLLVPVAGLPVTGPLALGALGLGAAATAWFLRPGPGPRLVDLRALPRLAEEVDLPGALLLAGVLGCLVLAFSTAEATGSAVSDTAPVLLAAGAGLAVLLVLRERRARTPILPAAALRARPAWGGQLVSLFTGAALVAVLVDVPIFARVTVAPDDQLAAALVLLRFLVAVPVGAVLGGALAPRLGVRGVAGAGLLLTGGALATATRWGPDAFAGGPGAADLALVLAGLGIGLAVAPVNIAVLRAVRADLHGLASALVVVSRSVGMLVGLSVLSTVGLRYYAAQQAEIGSPLTLCPATPTRCPAYEEATRAAVLGELHVILGGAAVCAVVAAVLAALLLGSGRRAGSPAAGEPATGEPAADAPATVDRPAGVGR